MFDAFIVCNIFYKEFNILRKDLKLLLTNLIKIISLKFTLKV